MKIKIKGYSDYLAVVNGPEDGNQFPILRYPFEVGNEPSCAVCLRLDNTVRGVHARLSAVEGGYSVRAMSSAPVYVSRKRAGLVRSRVLKNGEHLKVGHTEFVLRCVEDGVANRSKGIITESDALWALRQSVSIGRAILSRVLRFAKGFVFWVVDHPFKAFIAGLIVMCVLVPNIRARVFYYIWYAFDWVRYMLS